MTNQIDLSTLTAEELQAEIERRKTAEQDAKIKEKKAFDSNKEAFLTHTSGKFNQLQAELRQLKDFTISKANELYEQMYRMEGKEPREVQSFQMKNKADTIKVVVDRQQILEFNENAEVHINAIKDIFQAKFESRNKSMYGYINDILIKNSKGDYDPRLITKVRQRASEEGHADILAELEKLEACRRVTGTALYCRCYIRNDKKKWQDITLQFSAL